MGFVVFWDFLDYSFDGIFKQMNGLILRKSYVLEN